MSKSLRSPTHAALMSALIAERRERGLTQQQLASALQRPQSYVAKIETGERRLDVVEFIEFSEALDVRPEHLLSRVLEAISAS